MSEIAPNTAKASSAERQPAHALSKLPTGTQSTAITPRPDSPLLTTRAASSGAYKSRAIARAHITGAPMAAPCSARQMIRPLTESTQLLATLATTYSANPTSNTGLRPYLSDTGPHMSWLMPKHSKSAESVSCACGIEAPKACVMPGRAGR